MNRTSVDSYLQNGCGRCERYQTPECVVHLWTEALVELRALVLESGLEEEMKWGSPCYTLEGKNVVMIASHKEYCALSFFKGAALHDEDELLEKPGPNTRVARMVKFRSLEEVLERRSRLEALLAQAIELERAGTKVEVEAEPEPLPAELAQRLAEDPVLNAAFEALTPGRQRSFVIYVSGAKQSATRAKRVERCVPKIMAGKGYNEW